MRKSRYETDHARYLRKREEILEKQRIYRETHKAEIKERRRKREFEKRYLSPRPSRPTQQEYNRCYYLKHREEILAKQRNYDRRKREQRAATENAGGTAKGKAGTILA